jgi:hypothetical protein
MEDFRHVSRLADVQLDRWKAVQEAREAAERAPTLSVRHLNLRRVLLSLTVVILGMAAWWGM